MWKLHTVTDVIRMKRKVVKRHVIRASRSIRMKQGFEFPCLQKSDGFEVDSAISGWYSRPHTIPTGARMIRRKFELVTVLVFSKSVTFCLKTRYEFFLAVEWYQIQRLKRKFFIQGSTEVRTSRREAWNATSFGILGNSRKVKFARCGENSAEQRVTG